MIILNEEERKRGMKSLLLIFAIMLGTYVFIWFFWSEYEKVLNEFKVLPTLQIEKANWTNIYKNQKVFDTKYGDVLVNKIDETSYTIKYKNFEFHEKAFRYFNVRELNKSILISFPSFYLRGIKNILIDEQNNVYTFYKVPIDLQDEYDLHFANFLLRNINSIELMNIPNIFKNRDKKENSIIVNSKYTKFFLEDINKIYKLSDNMFVFVKNSETEDFIEYYMVNAEEENREEKNFVLRIFLLEK
ncbi:hypothetical protein JCM30566_19300 [Marinitoga arctica]